MMGKIDLGVAFSKGWELFSKNMAPLIVGTLLTVIIGTFSVGILYPVMMGGLFGIVRKSWAGETAEIGDVFGGFSNFLNFFLGGLLMGVIVFIGVLVCFIGVFPAAGAVVFMFPLIVEGAKPGEAFSKNWAAFKENWLGLIVLALVTGVVQSAGSIAIYIGMLFTMPFAMCVQWVAYKQTFGE
jgi:uncharacterized membrane protein